jgi:hypothetical protein
LANQTDQLAKTSAADANVRGSVALQDIQLLTNLTANSQVSQATSLGSGMTPGVNPNPPSAPATATAPNSAATTGAPAGATAATSLERAQGINYVKSDGTVVLQPFVVSEKKLNSGGVNSDFAAVVGGFQNLTSPLQSGYTLGNTAPWISGGTIVAAEYAGPALIAASKDIHVEARGQGTIVQVRYRSTPLIRLDYNRYPGSGGEPRLHLNIGPGKDNIHIPIDPRSWFE